MATTDPTADAGAPVTPPVLFDEHVAESLESTLCVFNAEALARALGLPVETVAAGDVAAVLRALNTPEACRQLAELYGTLLQCALDVQRALVSATNTHYATREFFAVQCALDAAPPDRPGAPRPAPFTVALIPSSDKVS